MGFPGSQHFLPGIAAVDQRSGETLRAWRAKVPDRAGYLKHTYSAFRGRLEGAAGEAREYQVRSRRSRLPAFHARIPSLAATRRRFPLSLLPTALSWRFFYAGG